MIVVANAVIWTSAMRTMSRADTDSLRSSLLYRKKSSSRCRRLL
jgi:hypothetical protein